MNPIPLWEAVNIEVMALSKKELSRRIQAARAVRGLSQADVGAKMEAEGFGKLDVSRIERAGGENEPTKEPPPFTPSRRRALAMIVDLPEAWFTADDVVDLFSQLPPSRDVTEQVERMLEHTRRMTAMLTKAREGLGITPESGGDDPTIDDAKSLAEDLRDPATADPRARESSS